MESISELRRRLQEPVRPYNDIAGVLVGDRASLPITRLFLLLGLNPTVGTIGMLVCGLAGSILVLFGDTAAVFGFVLVFFYYILDCVDGEVARYHKIEKLAWGFHEFFFHLIVKSAFFTCVGISAARSTGNGSFLALALTALLATLYLKFLRDVSITQVSRAVLLKSREEGAWVVDQLAPDPDAAPPSAPMASGGPVPFPSFGGPLATLRAAGTNFDLSLLLFLAAAIADLLVEPFDLFGAAVNLKSLTLAYYGLVLPLHFVDSYVTVARSGSFSKGCRELLSRADQFRIEREKRKS